MIDIRRSTVKRSRSALRMREKSPPLLLYGLRGPYAQALAIQRFDDFGGQDRLESRHIRALVP